MLVRAKPRNERDFPADDLFEPFRPFVDAKVFTMTNEGTRGDGEMRLDERRALAGLLGADVALGGETVSMLTAAERSAESLLRAMEAGTPALLSLPRIRDG